MAKKKTGRARKAGNSVKPRLAITTRLAPGRTIHFPENVIDRCLELMTPTAEEDWRVVYRPQVWLHPVLFVSKEWHRIAERRLYSSVKLGVSAFENPIVERAVFDAFHRTVTKTPRLASIVQELRINATTSTLEQAVRYADLVTFCENLSKIAIEDYQWDTIEAFGNAIAQRSFVEFTFLCSGRKRRPVTNFCLTSKVLSCLPKWPLLRELHLANTGARFRFTEDDIGICDTQTLPCVATLRGCCPLLRTFSILDGLNPRQLLLFPEAFPNADTVSLNIKCHPELDNQLTDTLRTCLQRWSPNLKELLLPLWENNIPSIASTCIALPKLRSLMVSSSSIVPEMLDKFTRLESLTYNGCKTEHFEQLSSHLWGIYTLPNLRELTLDLDASERWFLITPLVHFAVQKIRLICKMRKISFTVAENLQSRF